MDSPILPGFHVYQPAAWLRVSGADAADFLQGQFTNELRGIRADDAVYGLWLNQKGRVLADSFVLRGDGPAEFWVGSIFSTATVIRERLEAYIIADDVVIDDATVAWAGIALVGEGAGAWMAREPRPGRAFRGRRTRGENLEWMLPTESRAAAVEELSDAGARELSAAEMERQRIAAGIPAVPADLGPHDLPNEGGLETDAISYTKGCYLGQEVMARLKSMGQVRRQLRRVRGPGWLPALPAALFQGERKVGELRTAVTGEEGGFTGLAMLTLMNLQPGVAFGLVPGTEPVIMPAEPS